MVSDSGAALAGVGGVGLGKMLGFITLAGISQAFVFGAVGAIGGVLGKKLIVTIVNYIQNNKKTKTKI